MGVLTVDLNLLNLILDWQMSTAWIGEVSCELSRLGWWHTDLIDELGESIFFARFLPHTKLPIVWENGFHHEAITNLLSDRCGESKYELVAGGREIHRNDIDTSRLLSFVTVLVPFDQNYPIPFYRIV